MLVFLINSGRSIMKLEWVVSTGIIIFFVLNFLNFLLFMLFDMSALLKLSKFLLLLLSKLSSLQVPVLRITKEKQNNLYLIKENERSLQYHSPPYKPENTRQG